MKKCLYCEKEFEEKRDAAKFCSVSHRVMWNRKNKDKLKKIKSEQMLNNIYNNILELLDARNGISINSEPVLIKEAAPYFILKKECDIKSGAKTSSRVHFAPEHQAEKVKLLEENALEAIKQSCPKNLSGLDKSIWIEEQKVLHGIK